MTMFTSLGELAHGEPFQTNAVVFVPNILVQSSLFSAELAAGVSILSAPAGVGVSASPISTQTGVVITPQALFAVIAQTSPRVETGAAIFAVNVPVAGYPHPALVGAGAAVQFAPITATLSITPVSVVVGATNQLPQVEVITSLSTTSVVGGVALAPLAATMNAGTSFGGVFSGGASIVVTNDLLRSIGSTLGEYAWGEPGGLISVAGVVSVTTEPTNVSAGALVQVNTIGVSLSSNADVFAGGSVYSSSVETIPVLGATDLRAGAYISPGVFVDVSPTSPIASGGAQLVIVTPQPITSSASSVFVTGGGSASPQLCVTTISAIPPEIRIGATIENAGASVQIDANSPKVSGGVNILAGVSLINVGATDTLANPGAWIHCDSVDLLLSALTPLLRTGAAIIPDGVVVDAETSSASVVGGVFLQSPEVHFVAALSESVPHARRKRPTIQFIAS